MKFVTLCLFALLFNATAQADWLYCENGDIADVGDGYISVELGQDGSLTVNPYEGSFSIAGDDVNQRAFTLWAVNKKVTYQVEGEVETKFVNVMATYDSDANTLELVYQFDMGSFRAVSLTCR